MRSSVLRIVIASAIYGFACGSVHSARFGAHDLLKFPLLLLGTAALCGPGYALLAAFAGLRLRLLDAERIALALFADAALLLAALAPAGWLLARTIEKPDAHGLGEYPLFLGLNVVAIAACGVLALARHARVLVAAAGDRPRRAALALAGWLALSLLAGGQVAWYLRPFFGVASIDGRATRFCLGASPDYRGATNFYEAVYHLVRPPPLPADWLRRGRGD